MEPVATPHAASNPAAATAPPPTSPRPTKAASTAAPSTTAAPMIDLDKVVRIRTGELDADAL